MEKTDIYAIALRSEQTAIGLEKEVNLALRYAKDCTSPLTKEYVDMAERFCAMLNDAHSLAS